MKIVLSENQLIEAIELYASMISGHNVSGGSINLDRTSGKYEVVITLKNEPKVPKIQGKAREITQADVEAVYSPVTERKPDVS